MSQWKLFPRVTAASPLASKPSIESDPASIKSSSSEPPDPTDPPDPPDTRDPPFHSQIPTSTVKLRSTKSLRPETNTSTTDLSISAHESTRTIERYLSLPASFTCNGLTRVIASHLCTIELHQFFSGTPDHVSDSPSSKIFTDKSSSN
ncbi:unnamed protein product [Arabis nemorensis]|uniref:Uncharacterized protein n=1 Tax=Arabis nemorensis TaxID=586526 RepID=A0A565AKW1_9BRAS|nr:unnamed protein product [Arabis nemorensis]